jgi:hypothetical protein
VGWGVTSPQAPRCRRYRNASELRVDGEDGGRGGLCLAGLGGAVGALRDGGQADPGVGAGGKESTCRSEELHTGWCRCRKWNGEEDSGGADRHLCARTHP